MESRERVEAKGRILVDALVMCLSRSKVSAVADAQTLRSVIDSALGELWREGEFRLEAVWKILIQQPGVSAAEVAPPFFVMKAHEEQLGVQVRLPPALASLPRGEQQKLRDTLPIPDEDFAKSIEALRQLAEAEKEKRDLAAQVQQATASAAAAPVAAAPVAAPQKKSRRGLAIGLSVLALGTMAGALYIAFGPTESGFDTADVAALLKLKDALRAGPTLTAHIDDARWDALPKDEQKRVATQVFEREKQKGIEFMMLRDGANRVRVTASADPQSPMVIY